MRDRAWARLAFAWCLGFGLLSLAWSAGIDLGVHQLSPAIQDQAGQGGAGFTLILVVTGVAKIVGGFVPLAWVSNTWPSFTRVLGWLTLAGGVLLTLYGLGDIVSGVLGVSGIRESATRADRDAAFWYLVLWGPVWLLGGITFLGTWLTHPHNATVPRS